MRPCTYGIGQPKVLPLNGRSVWLTLLGPLFGEIWPLDAALRDEGSSRNLVMMALQVDTSFPDAVDAIGDLIVPYELDLLAHSLLLQHEHAALVARYPRAFLRLTSALIDPTLHSIPRDLGQLLQRCVDADLAAEANRPTSVFMD
jgi:hypothetical protein